MDARITVAAVVHLQCSVLGPGLRRNHRSKRCSFCSSLLLHWLLANYQPDKYELETRGLWTALPCCDPFASCNETRMWSVNGPQNLTETHHLPCNVHINEHDKMGGRNEDVANIQALDLFFSTLKPLWLDCKTAHMDSFFNTVTWLVAFFFHFLWSVRSL